MLKQPWIEITKTRKRCHRSGSSNLANSDVKNSWPPELLDCFSVKIVHFHVEITHLQVEISHLRVDLSSLISIALSGMVIWNQAITNRTIVTTIIATASPESGEIIFRRYKEVDFTQRSKHCCTEINLNHYLSWILNRKQQILPVLQKISRQWAVHYNPEMGIVHNWICYVTEAVQKKLLANMPAKLPPPRWVTRRIMYSFSWAGNPGVHPALLPGPWRGLW